ncbi:hypothetical protein [Oleiharenicola lentus]|uniref:hypothetical protein n=1 Tax=Oleiharenicola lentus TaxID=2508720 RepID=UPI003F679644
MKATRSLWTIALGLLALAIAAPATSFAQEGHKEKKPSKATLEQYDANKDGVLSEEENAAAKAGAAAKAKATKEANLAKYDADKDGKLSESEKATKKADDDAAKAAKKAEKDAKKAAK